MQIQMHAKTLTYQLPIIYAHALAQFLLVFLAYLIYALLFWGGCISLEYVKAGHVVGYLPHTLFILFRSKWGSVFAHILAKTSFIRYMGKCCPSLRLDTTIQHVICQLLPNKRHAACSLAAHTQLPFSSLGYMHIQGDSQTDYSGCLNSTGNTPDAVMCQRWAGDKMLSCQGAASGVEYDIIILNVGTLFSPTFSFMFKLNSSTLASTIAQILDSYNSLIASCVPPRSGM